MASFVKWMDQAPKLLKIIFALPGLDLIWGIYRLCRSLKKKSVVGTVLAIVLLILSPFVVWIIDLITIIVSNKVLWID